MQLTVKVDQPSKVLRKLTITVPAETVSHRLEEKMIEIQRTAKLKGFRPGMVPLSVVKRVYGEDARQRVLHSLIDESFGEAVRREKLHPVSRPTIEAPGGGNPGSVREGESVTYVATVEIMPEIGLRKYSGFKLTRGKAEVTPKDVTELVDNLRDRHAQLVPAEVETVAKGHFVDMEFSGGIVTPSGVEEKPGMKGSRVVEVGSGDLIPGFEDQLVGMSPGSSKTFRVRFPDDFPEKELASQEAEFQVKLNEIKAKKVPALDDDFAKEAGYESVDDLTNKAKQGLLRARTEDAESRVRGQLLQTLIDENPFDVPPTLVQAQLRLLIQELSESLRGRGFNDEMVGQALESEQKNLIQRAENQVRSGLILDAVARKEGLEVAPDQVEAEIKKMSAGMNVDVDRLRDHYKDHRRRENLEFRIREDLTVSWILERSKVSESA